MGVAPMPSHGRWAVYSRGGGRAVRVSAHAEGGFLVVSTWKVDTCVGTVRLLPAEAAELVAGITEGLAHLAAGVVQARLEELERRLARLEIEAR